MQKFGVPTRLSSFLQTGISLSNIHLFFAHPQASAVESSNHGIDPDRGLGPSVRKSAGMAGAAVAHGSHGGSSYVLREGTDQPQGGTRARNRRTPAVDRSPGET